MRPPFRKWKLKEREGRRAKMAKDGQLWDDSALTNAFDQAMSNYKKMHIKGYGECSDSSRESKTKEVAEAPSSSEIGGDISSKTFKTAEGQVDDLPFAIDNKALETKVNQKAVEVPNDIPLQDHIQSTSQGQEEYDLLCKQYYELEEKRGQIWEKLKQYGHSDYSYPVETSGPCTLWPQTSASQNQNYSSQACYPATAITCCPNIYPCSATSCSLSTCSLGYSGPCAGSSLMTSNERMVEDDDIIKKGMVAAQKALSKLKEDASGCQLEERLGQKEPNSNGETDLSDVLNAWYSAGLYTGKYLTEKSLAKPGNC